MRRRELLAEGALACGMVGLAGCADAVPVGDSTPAGDPASRLDVADGGWVVQTSGDSVVIGARFTATNTTATSVRADFGASIVPTATDGEFSGDPVEKSVPADGSVEVTVYIVDEEALRHDQLTAIYFDEFLLEATVDGTPRPDLCPGLDGATSTEAGCTFRHGIYDSYLEVVHRGDWEATIETDDTGIYPVSRDTADYGAPPGYDTSYVVVPAENRASATVRKKGGGTDELVARLVDEGEVVDEARTTVADGTVEVRSTDMD